MLPTKNVGRVCYPPKTQAKYVTRQKRQALCLPYMIPFFVGRVCYPPISAGKMPALRDQIQLAPASDSLDAAVGVEFAVDILGMHANGIYTHHQCIGDIIGSERAGQQP